MAPGLTATLPSNTPTFGKQIPRSIFPDGIKTSGQHPPLYHRLSPYQDFPYDISGPTVWNADDYKHNPERWTHCFTDDEITEMSEAADQFRDSGVPLTGISKVKPKEKHADTTADIALGQLPAASSFHFPRGHSQRTPQRQRLHSIQGLSGREVGQSQVSHRIHGTGYILGILCQSKWERSCPRPCERSGRRCETNRQSQDLSNQCTVGTLSSKGLLSCTPPLIPHSQYFHADDSDLVGLLCIARALEGGESDITSVHNVYNTLRRERPDVLKTLTEPIWYFDRKGEVSEGEDPYIRTSVFYLEPGGQRRVYCK